MKCFALVVVTACHAPTSHVAPDAGSPDAPAAIGRATITATLGSTRFVVREHMLAAGEMQISGEPLAEAMGRDLGGYSRDLLPGDIYSDPRAQYSWIDLAGFSTAIESYEYSKQPMNELAFESGAGTALAYAPLVADESTLTALVQHFAAASNASGKWVFPAGTFPIGNTFGDRNPDGLGDPARNPLGWPGIWPTAHVFASFDPELAPSSTIDLRCSIASDDNPNEEGNAPLISSDFECDATTLHLPDRVAQVDPTITPGADGFATWKYGLWTINYLQVMHDSTGAAVASVADGDLVGVGMPGNTIVGYADDGTWTAPGTYIGSSDIEGFQAQMFLQIADSRAADWLLALTTTDGATLSGFASIAAALAYDDAAPLRWFPARIAVTETAGGTFPQPAYALASADSSLLDLVGVAMGYSEIYALTDARNAVVGGAQTASAFFDGDPFAADDQLADGEPTLHDRALAMIRVAIVNIDRMHVDPATGIAVDVVGTTRGTTISTTSAAYTVIGLRTARRALTSQLQLYSNNTPDTAGAPSAFAATFSARLDRLLLAHADLLYDHLTDATGRAWAGWNVSTSAPVDPSDALDAHAAAVRGLFAAYLATGAVRYRDRAIAVYRRMDAVFYDPVARLYTASPAPTDSVEYTPVRFALVQSALRDMYELVATRPGGEALEPVLEDRIGRLDKLVLNGWDDRDHDKLLAYPDECVRVVDGLPRGGLQLGERTLSGEVGRLNDEGMGGGPPTTDREHDCVPAIDAAHISAALADSITFTITRQP